MQQKDISPKIWRDVKEAEGIIKFQGFDLSSQQVDRRRIFMQVLTCTEMNAAT
jgi:hypothetical protein